MGTRISIVGDSCSPLKTPVGRLGRVLRLTLHPTQEPQRLSLLEMERTMLNGPCTSRKNGTGAPSAKGAMIWNSAQGSGIKTPLSRPYLFLYSVEISGCCKPESSTSALEVKALAS